MQKKVLAIHDISCVGRCSLTVALPILSCAGIETSVLPTAILSTHTGEFQGFTYRDLSPDIPPMLHHWDSLSLAFDGLYSGFLGSFEQIALIEGLFRRYQTGNTLIMVDPAMADNGKLYQTYTRQMAQGTKRLCAVADIIVPNMTEAAILLDRPYEENCTEIEIESMLESLGAMGPRYVVLTGITFKEGMLGIAAFDKHTKELSYAFQARLPHTFFGTGDVLASAILSAMLRNHSLESAVQIASDFVSEAIGHTLENKTALRYGVAFEQALPAFMRALEPKRNLHHGGKGDLPLLG